MKKNVYLTIVSGILIGYFISIMLTSGNSLDVDVPDGNIYYIQYGVYTSKETALNNVNNIESYIMSESDEKYYVYLGITTNYDHAVKIQKMYLDKNIYTYIRGDYVNDTKLLEELTEYDELITADSKNSEIYEVMNEVLKNYQDLSF